MLSFVPSAGIMKNHSADRAGALLQESENLPIPFLTVQGSLSVCSRTFQTLNYSTLQTQFLSDPSNYSYRDNPRERAGFQSVYERLANGQSGAERNVTRL